MNEEVVTDTMSLVLRLETSLNEVISYCATFPMIEVYPLTQEIILRSFEIDDIPELHDRIISGTDYSTKLFLITNDPVIYSSPYVTGIW